MKANMLTSNMNKKPAENTSENKTGDGLSLLASIPRKSHHGCHDCHYYDPLKRKESPCCQCCFGSESRADFWLPVKMNLNNRREQ